MRILLLRQTVLCPGEPAGPHVAAQRVLEVLVATVVVIVVAIVMVIEQQERGVGGYSDGTDGGGVRRALSLTKGAVDGKVGRGRRADPAPWSWLLPRRPHGLEVNVRRVLEPLHVVVAFGRPTLSSSGEDNICDTAASAPAPTPAPAQAPALVAAAAAARTRTRRTAKKNENCGGTWAPRVVVGN